ncbi:putative mariner transposase [Trichonephila clavipes]|nr:putative mariner transposase [Trichonephila clavipes]
MERSETCRRPESRGVQFKSWIEIVESLKCECRWGKTTHSFHKIPFPVNRANVKTAIVTLGTGDLPSEETTRIVEEQILVLHQDNAPPLLALSVKRFLIKYSILASDHPFNSSDLELYYFYQFSKVKFAVKRSRFESVGGGKEKTAHVLNELTQDFQHYFKQWSIVGKRKKCT